jgi:hypothetical protein
LLVQYPLWPGRTVFLAEPALWPGAAIGDKNRFGATALPAPGEPSVALSIIAAAAGLAVVGLAWSAILV